MLGIDTQDTFYQEEVPLALWLKGLIGLVLLSLVGVLLGEGMAGISAGDRVGLVIGGVVTVVVALVAWNYRAIQIRVTRNGLEARYGRFNRTVIPLSEITECLAVRSSFGRYLGVGVRVGVDGSRAYTASFGPAVEVRRGSRRPFVVSSNRPQELCAVIKGAVSRSS